MSTAQTIPTTTPVMTSPGYTTQSASIPSAAADIAVGAAAQTAQKAQNLSSRSTYWLRNLFCWCANTFRLYLMRYPPLTAFFVALMATSSFPIIAFLTFAGLSLSVLSTIAIAIVGTIESGIMAVSGTLLGFVLIGCTILSFIGAGTIGMFWIGLALGRWFFRNIGLLYYSSGSAPVYTTYSRPYYYSSQPQTFGSASATGGISSLASAATEKASQAATSIAQKTEELRQTGQAVRATSG